MTSLHVMDLFRLDGDRALVTGAGSGLGRIAALTLAEAGATIAVIDIDGDAAETVAAEVRAAGGEATAWRLDVANEAEVIATVGVVIDRFRRIDILVNNAGVTKRLPTETFPTEEWRRIVDVNLNAVFFLSREVGAHMLMSGGGRIINMASIMGLSGGGFFPSIGYHATKGALVNITRALAAEWASRGIRVNAIAPTFVTTRLTEKLREDREMVRAIEARTPMGRFAAPEEIAGGVIYLASRASSMVTGHTLAIDGGFLAI